MISLLGRSGLLDAPTTAMRRVVVNTDWIGSVMVPLTQDAARGCIFPGAGLHPMVRGHGISQGP